MEMQHAKSNEIIVFSMILWFHAKSYIFTMHNLEYLICATSISEAFQFIVYFTFFFDTLSDSCEHAIASVRFESDLVCENQSICHSIFFASELILIELFSFAQGHLNSYILKRNQIALKMKR